jgi:hypothetical protein
MKWVRGSMRHMTRSLGVNDANMRRTRRLAVGAAALLTLGCASPRGEDPGEPPLPSPAPAAAPDAAPVGDAAAAADAATAAADAAIADAGTLDRAPDLVSPPAMPPDAAADRASAGVAPTISLFEPEACGLSASINGVARPALGASIDTIEFDWNDGVVEKRGFPAVHAYRMAGTYTVKGTALQSDGLSASATRSVAVTLPSGTPPTVFLLAPAIEGRTAAINGGTSPGDPATPIKAISWDWGDGTVNESFFPHRHTYASAGMFTVRVTSRQCDGQTATTTAVVTVR